MVWARVADYTRGALDQVRLFTELEDARRILIAGAGGGYDVYAGIPLYAALRRRGGEVFLGNLSFTDLHAVQGARVTKASVEVGPDTPGPDSYFPERSLARFIQPWSMVKHASQVRSHRAAALGVLRGIRVRGNDPI